MSAASEALELRSVGVSRSGRTILDDVTLPAMATGELTAFVGPNGAGKSTLLKAVAQILPASGTMRFGAHDLATMPRRERARLIGYMPQSLPADTELSVVDSVMVALGAGGRATVRQAVGILARLGLADLALQPLDRLSGGQRQLVSLAQTIANEPRLLLLDEPTSALDLARQYEVMRCLRAMALAGAAVIVVLHDLALAARWADRIVVLKRGTIYCAAEPTLAITPSMLADVYGLHARIERAGPHLQIHAEGLVSGHLQPSSDALS